MPPQTHNPGAVQNKTSCGSASMEPKLLYDQGQKQDLLRRAQGAEEEEAQDSTWYAFRSTHTLHHITLTNPT
jgi:hypothetical protein